MATDFETSPKTMDVLAGSRIATFILKVYTILEDNLFPEIIDWNIEGSTIIIKKPTDFAQKVLPKYFKHNHITSFIRQLNMYGFQKKKSRFSGQIYSHELFLKGQKHLLGKIKRRTKDNVLGIPSTASPQESVTKDSSKEASELLTENKALKTMKDEACNKVRSLEEKIRFLIMQNQSLSTRLKQTQMQITEPSYNVSAVKIEGIKQEFSTNDEGSYQSQGMTPNTTDLETEDPFGINKFFLSNENSPCGNVIQSQNQLYASRYNSFNMNALYQNTEQAKSKPTGYSYTFSHNKGNCNFAPESSILGKRPFDFNQRRSNEDNDEVEDTLFKFFKTDEKLQMIPCTSSVYYDNPNQTLFL